MTFLLLGGVLLGATDVIAGFVDTPDVLLASADDSLGARHDRPVDDRFDRRAARRPRRTRGDLPGLRQAGRGRRRPMGRTHPEWATATPPPVGNFAEPPARVRSEAPLLDETPGDEEGLMTATTTQLAAPAIRRPRTVLVGTMFAGPPS